MTRIITVTAEALVEADGDLRRAIDDAIPHAAKHEIVVLEAHGRPMSTLDEAFRKGEDYEYAIEVRDGSWQVVKDEIPEVVVHAALDENEDGLEVVVPTWEEYQEALADLDEDEFV